jgi:uncharacterized membrane protein
MNELTDTATSVLYSVGALTVVLLNIISLVVIIMGVILSFVKRAKQRYNGTELHPRHTYFRRMLGGWLIVALEFQLAADIVGTILTPDYQELIKLGAIAVIRTFLNYFLNKELEEETTQTK